MTSYFDKSTRGAPSAQGWLLEFTAEMQLSTVKVVATLYVGAFSAQQEADVWYTDMRSTLKNQFAKRTTWQIKQGDPVACKTQQRVATLQGGRIIRKINARHMTGRSPNDSPDAFLVVPPCCPHTFARNIRDIVLERLNPV